MLKPRNKWLAAFLSFLIAGLGYLYVGHARRAFVVLFLLFLLDASLVSMGLWPTFTGFVAGLFMAGLVRLYAIVDCFLLAKRKPNLEPRPYMKSYIYLAYAFAFLLAIGAVRHFRGELLGYQAYAIGGKAMAPMIMPGDYMLVDTKYYRFHTLLPGDIIAVHLNKDIYIRRVLAIEENEAKVATDQEGSKPSTVNLEDIEGPVTYIFYSRSFHRIGHKIL